MNIKKAIIKKTIQITLIFSVVLTSMLAWGITQAANKAIYKHVLPDGQVVYSNIAGPGSEEMKIARTKASDAAAPQTNSDAMPPSSDADSTEKAAAGGPKSYQVKFMIPQNDQVYTADQSKIEVNLQLSPELDKNDRVRLFVDEKPYGDLQAGTHYMLSDLERGSHSLQAKVYQEDGMGEAKGKTGPIAIHVQKTIAKTNRGP